MTRGLVLPASLSRYGGDEDFTQMMSSNEAAHPFYRPLWVRVCLVASLIGWSALEWFHAASFWGIVTAAAAVWAIWTFFVTYDPNAAKGAKNDTGPHAPEGANEPD